VSSRHCARDDRLNAVKEGIGWGGCGYLWVGLSGRCRHRAAVVESSDSFRGCGSLRSSFYCGACFASLSETVAPFSPTRNRPRPPQPTHSPPVRSSTESIRSLKPSFVSLTKTSHDAVSRYNASQRAPTHNVNIPSMSGTPVPPEDQKPASASAFSTRKFVTAIESPSPTVLTGSSTTRLAWAATATPS